MDLGNKEQSAFVEVRNSSTHLGPVFVVLPTLLDCQKVMETEVIWPNCLLIMLSRRAKRNCLAINICQTVPFAHCCRF